MMDLKAMGWRPVVIWECQTRNTEELTDLLTRIFQATELPEMARKIGQQDKWSFWPTNDRVETSFRQRG